MNGAKLSIDAEIRTGKRSQGAELAQSDVGRTLSPSFGRVQSLDVGKRVWLRDFGVTMENDEQRDARKAKAPASLDIAPPAELFAIVKVRRCAQHDKPSVQQAYTDEHTATVIAANMSPFGSCGLCTYEARRYILATE